MCKTCVSTTIKSPNYAFTATTRYNPISPFARKYTLCWWRQLLSPRSFCVGRTILRGVGDTRRKFIETGLPGNRVWPCSLDRERGGGLHASRVWKKNHLFFQCFVKHTVRVRFDLWLCRLVRIYTRDKMFHHCINAYGHFDNWQQEFI